MASVVGIKVRALGVVGVLALSSVFVVVAATRADAAVVVTVDPSTGLADGQPVTITGSGFTPGASVGAAQCSALSGQSRSTNDCDITNAPITQADSSGTAVLHLRARAHITTPNSGDVDCVNAVDPCVMGMGDINDLQNPEKVGGAAITFDPNAPPVPPPAVSLTPSDDLVDRQQVAVYATGFIPGEFVTIVQCAVQNLDKTPCNETFGYGYGGANADPTGAVAFGLTVRRGIRVDNERFDCGSAPGACVVVAQAAGGPQGTAPLAFDPSVPLPPPPTLTVTPSDGLADGQIVSVHGEGFAPNFGIALLQCPSDANSAFGGCASEYSRGVNSDANGAFSTTLKVEREQQVYGPTPQPTTVDCAESAGRCIVTAVDYTDDLDTASTPISFDPSKPPAPPAAATANPNTGLVDGQNVTLTGDGFPPGTSVFLVECKAGSTDSSGCDLSRLTNVQVDDNGHLETQFAVQRILTLGPPIIPPPVPTTVPKASDGRANAALEKFLTPTDDPSTFDCASAPGACVLTLAILGPQVEFATAPLSFDPSVPPSTPTTAAGPGQPTDSGGDSTTSAPSTSTTASPSTAAPTVNGAPLARTGEDFRWLRYDLLLLVVGAIALVCAAALRARAHRRSLRAGIYS